MIKNGGIGRENNKGRKGKKKKILKFQLKPKKHAWSRTRGEIKDGSGEEEDQSGK